MFYQKYYANAGVSDAAVRLGSSDCLILVIVSLIVPTEHKTKLIPAKVSATLGFRVRSSQGMTALQGTLTVMEASRMILITNGSVYLQRTLLFFGPYTPTVRTVDGFLLPSKCSIAIMPRGKRRSDLG